MPQSGLRRLDVPQRRLLGCHGEQSARRARCGPEKLSGSQSCFAGVERPVMLWRFQFYVSKSLAQCSVEIVTLPQLPDATSQKKRVLRGGAGQRQEGKAPAPYATVSCDLTREPRLKPVSLVRPAQAGYGENRKGTCVRGPRNPLRALLHCSKWLGRGQVGWRPSNPIQLAAEGSQRPSSRGTKSPR